MLNSGDKVLINGKEYILGARLGGGLEGNIFDVVGLPSHVIKIINDDKLSQLQKSDIYEHLKWLKDLGARNKNIRQCMTVPKALIDDYLGYIMLKASEHESLKKYLTIPEDSEQFNQWYTNHYTLKKRYQIICNLFSSLREIHLAGLIFTDLSPNNIMVHNKQNQIVFIDTDNTKRRSDLYNGVLGTPGYMAPEVYRKPDEEFANKNQIGINVLSKSGRLSSETDIFSAAIIAFQILTLQHPFIGDEIENGTPEGEEAALEIKTDYIFKKDTTNTSSYGLTNKFEEITTKEIRELFYRTFVAGKDNPSLRPTAEEFLEAFQSALDLIVVCPHCGFSRLYSFNQKNECINCDSLFKNKVFIVIYNVFQHMTIADGINSIGDYPKYDISIDLLRDIDGNLPPNYFEISRIILEPGEDKSKFLYLRHFEKTTDRSAKYARVTLSDSLNSIKLEVLNNSFDSPFLIEKNTKTIVPLNNGKEFPLDRYGIIFESKKIGKGNIQIFCKFVKD